MTSLIAQKEEQELLRFSTAGSVDDGKSTLIGRLLYDAKGLLEDQISALEAKAKVDGNQLDWALLTDGLKAEREQGITIDVAYRFFATPKRKFIIADTPGHEQYTRNMATGASTADLAIVLIDARHGVRTQSKRHAFIAALLGTPRLVVAVNKMDLVDYDVAVFEQIRADFDVFVDQLGIHPPQYVPISALLGDNVVTQSENMPWYEGPSLLHFLETTPVGVGRNLKELRFPVQYVSRPNQNFRGYSGQLLSGVVRKGDEVLIHPGNERATVSSIVTYDGELDEAFAPMSVTVTLNGERDISRGDMLVAPDQPATVSRDVEAVVVWMDHTPLQLNGTYILKHTSRKTRVVVEAVQYKVDVDEAEQVAGDQLVLNEIGSLKLTTMQPLFFDAYQDNRKTGSFILIDEQTNLTVAAGMILKAGHVHAGDHQTRALSSGERALHFNQQPFTLWVTGRVGAKQLEIAQALERALFERGGFAYTLDSSEPRNLFRLAEDAALLNKAGLVAIVVDDLWQNPSREAARSVIGGDAWFVVHVDAGLGWVEANDQSGFYNHVRGQNKQLDRWQQYQRNQVVDADYTVQVEQIETGVVVDRILTALEEAGRISPAQAEYQI
ncbi:sulfate adenylyltransferase subunit CysN [Acanthopleuribacter pedis]|uniref:Sulfate adenylyltransferase subunit 1 n=1 Tax=Acanthopleuribacter pedis TaxID=442870 RepID=A0A8J7QGH8_9BACT|nr:sulfate adenylyltransferase subunit CysN [Acanthopleuribacter pedis]